MKTPLLASLAFLGICMVGCSERPAPVVTGQQGAQQEAAQNHLPLASYPTAKLEIEKPNARKCSVSIDFSRWPRVSSWNRLACGINYITYDARIEYLGHSAKGDRYKITILQPYEEDEKHVDAVPIAYDGEIDYMGGDQKVYESSGVTFTLKS